MTLQDVRKLKQGCPCEEVTNKECCNYCGYLNTKFGWECRYCDNLTLDNKWRDKYACRHAKKAMLAYAMGEDDAFYNGNKNTKQGDLRHGHC